MNSRTITFELKGYEIERRRKAINALKDFNRTTDEKAEIGYDVIQNLDYVDQFIGRLVGLEQPTCEHGHRNAWADYEWVDNT